METRLRREAGSDDRSIAASDSQTIEGPAAAAEEEPPTVNAHDSPALPRVPPADAASPAVETQQSSLRPDDPNEGGGDPTQDPIDGSADSSDPASTSPTTSGRPTAAEISHPVAAEGSAPPDSDADGLTDSQEAQLGTDPFRADTDRDGLTDAEELAIRSDPTNPDTDVDGDGVADAQERARGTNPTDRDTDDDGANDRIDRDPLRAPDSDVDGLPDHVERRAGLDPDHWDTDRDGLPDGDEVHVFGTDPKNPDSDGDGTNDFDEAWETYNAAQRDTDGDGLTDVEEARLGTDPTNADTDGDGLTDSQEVGTGSLRDWTWQSGTGTDPLRADSDEDGFSDGTERGRGTDPLDRASQPLHASGPEDGTLSATGASSTVASADEPRPSVQAADSSSTADGATQQHPAWDGEQREFLGFGRVELPDAGTTNEGEERDMRHRDDVDPGERTVSDGSVLEATDLDSANAPADAASGAEPSTESPPDQRPDRQTDDAGWPLGLDPPPPAPTRREAAPEGQSLAPAAEPDRPTLEAAPGDSSADAASPGLTREAGAYGHDDPRHSGDEEPTLDDKTQVDLSDTAPDGTLLRQGLTDFAGNEITRSHDLGGGLPEGMTVPGSDRLSGMMDPLALAASGGGTGAVGGRGGGIDPRLASGGEENTPGTDDHFNLVNEQRGATGLAPMSRADYDALFSGGSSAGAGENDGRRISGDVRATLFSNLTDEQVAKLNQDMEDSSAEFRAELVEEFGAEAVFPADDDGQSAADEIQEEQRDELFEGMGDDESDDAEPAESQPDDTTTVPAEVVRDPLTPEQMESALRARQPGYVDPPPDAHSAGSGTQAVMAEGESSTASSQRPSGGGVASTTPDYGLDDPPPPEIDQPMGSGTIDHERADPNFGIIDPPQDPTAAGPTPTSGAEGTGVGTGGPGTDAPASGQAGTGDPRNAPPGGPATQGGGAEPGVGAPVSLPPGGGDVAVDPTEDEPQYGMGTGTDSTGTVAADPLGMDIATAPPVVAAPAAATPQGQEIGPGGGGDAEPAIKIDGGAAISMETGQVIPPPGGPPEPDLSGANLQGEVFGTADSSGLPGGPGVESSPLGAPPDPDTAEPGEGTPSSSDDDGMP